MFLLLFTLIFNLSLASEPRPLACELLLLVEQDESLRQKSALLEDPLNSLRDWNHRAQKSFINILTREFPDDERTELYHQFFTQYEKWFPLIEKSLIKQNLFKAPYKTGEYISGFELQQNGVLKLFPWISNLGLKSPPRYLVIPGMNLKTGAHAAFEQKTNSVIVPDGLIFDKPSSSDHRFVLHELVHLKFDEMRRQTRSLSFLTTAHYTGEKAQEFESALGIYLNHFRAEEIATNLITLLSTLEKVCDSKLDSSMVIRDTGVSNAYHFSKYHSQVLTPLLMSGFTSSNLKGFRNEKGFVMKWENPELFISMTEDFGFGHKKMKEVRAELLRSLMGEGQFSKNVFETLSRYSRAFENELPSREFHALKVEQLRVFCPAQNELWKAIDQIGLKSSKFKNLNLPL